MAKGSVTSLDIIPVSLVSVLLFLQIILGIYFLPNLKFDLISYGGIVLYVFSSIVFGILPIAEFRKKGDVKRGKSYIHTTRIVESGIYAIVRHPQFITWMLWSVAGMLVFQHWVVIVLGLPVFPLTYLDLIRADRSLILKFGKEYSDYINRVPRINVVLGLYRFFRYQKSL
jgi:protein-S-isoprenylcysteine O-methyltransferase Ste14